MPRPTFPARNQWNPEAQTTAASGRPAARVPPGTGPLVPTLPLDATPHELAAARQALTARRPAQPAMPHIVQVNRPGTVGSSGLGNAAAMRAHMVQSLQQSGLHEKARANLRPFRIPNVHLILGDGMLGYPSGAPYAGIIAAAGGEHIPQAWVDQLAMDGRIVAPAALGTGQQVLVVLDKTANGLQQALLEPVLFVPLKSGMA